MKRSYSLVALAIATVFAGSAIAPAIAGSNTTDSSVPTYKEFAASTYEDFDGQYVVNGDEVVGTNGDLKKFYEGMVGGGKTVEEGLIVNTVGGVDDKWSAAQALNLTYCVSTKFTGSHHTDVVNAMAAGGGLWEAQSSKVNFVYVPAQDANCNTRNNNVLFSVEPVNTTQYIARAFFPSTAKRSRNVLIDDSFWAMSYTQANVLGHELGHTLGFRHEHTRPEAGTCFEDNNWRALTPYDKNSIMHYPQCNGVAGQLTFSSSDGVGVRAHYGS